MNRVVAALYAVREESFDVLERHGLGELGEHVLEVGLGLDAVGLGVFLARVGRRFGYRLV